MKFLLTSRALFILLIVAFIIHNAEEAITICSHTVENPFSFVQPASCVEFLFSVSVLTFLALILFFVALKSKKESTYLFISTAFATALLLNAFIPHIFVAVYTLHYTPGLISAVLLTLPISILLLIKNKSFYTSNKQMLTHMAGGLAIGYLIFAMTMGFSRIIF